jgi:hypothetical protein
MKGLLLAFALSREGKVNGSNVDLEKYNIGGPF